MSDIDRAPEQSRQPVPALALVEDTYQPGRADTCSSPDGQGRTAGWRPLPAATPRRWEREPANIPLRLVLKGDRFKADDSAVTLDISLCGAKVRTNLVLSAGDLVGVVPQGGFPQAIPSRVAWAREDESTLFTFAGLEFLQPNAARNHADAQLELPWALDERQAA